MPRARGKVVLTLTLMDETLAIGTPSVDNKVSLMYGAHVIL